MGKTNLLDAIHYCCFSRSYFTRTEQQLVHQGFQGFRLDAQLDCNGRQHQFTAILRETGKKELQLDAEPITRVSQYVGRFPVVMICPDDTLLITGTSEERRRYMDMLFSQLDPEYLQLLGRYNKILVQRNSLLKQDERTDNALLDIYDNQLYASGTALYERRAAFLDKLIPRINAHYQQISGGAESLHCLYQSQLRSAPLLQLLKAGREKDLILQRTRSGIHKDDLEFRLGDQPFRQVASQGQRKSLLFACKLAEFDLLKDQKGFPPLLLLDDVFEKLDAQRMHNLLEAVCLQNEGQVFITDTHEERIRAHFLEIGVPVELIRL